MISVTDTLGNGAVRQFFNIAASANSACHENFQTLTSGSLALSVMYPGTGIATATRTAAGGCQFDILILVESHLPNPNYSSCEGRLRYNRGNTSFCKCAPSTSQSRHLAVFNTLAGANPTCLATVQTLAPGSSASLTIHPPGTSVVTVTGTTPVPAH
ncbi:hypothetical protein FRB95_012967 [Tulasnella sp. JGI-2019a]|nr:hypothetical protein FRB95_012967 [Tulasnella sp. JGI-2019a]